MSETPNLATDVARLGPMGKLEDGYFGEEMRMREEQAWEHGEKLGYGLDARKQAVISVHISSMVPDLLHLLVR